MSRIDLQFPPGNGEVTLSQFAEKIRRFMRDNPYLNRLTDGYESSEEDIYDALEDALDDFNHTPPFTDRYNFNNPPPISMLKRGTVICLLESLGLLNTRNGLAFSDGGLSLNTNKTPELQAWLQMFSNKYYEKVQRWKTSVNIEAAWGGGLGSEYRLVNSQALLDSF